MNKCLCSLYLSVVLGAFGCAGDDGAASSGERTASVRDAGIMVPTNGQCLNDSECPEGRVCQGGVCVVPEQMTPMTCQGDADCSDGARCVDGACQGNEEGCADDSDCNLGERCVEGDCRSESGACMVDVECPPGQRCQEGMCVPAPSQGCMGDAECAMGQRCVDGQCVANPGGCAGDADCPMGETCQDGMCAVPPGGCLNDNECGPNASCVNGRCEPNNMPECAGNADCADGMICRNGQCLPENNNNGGECVVDGDCLPGLQCVQGMCQIAEGLGDPCDPNGQCPGPLVCVAGICLPNVFEDECQQDADCGEGMRCDAGACVMRGVLGDPCNDGMDCVEDFECRDGVCQEPAGDDLCAVNADCPAGMVCVAGFCEPGNGGGMCADDAECPAGSRCVAGVCQAGNDGDMCAGDEECPAGEICFNGQCQMAPGGCIDDLDCGGGDMRCVNGECVPTCIDDAECLFEQVCRGGVCVEDDGGGPVMGDACGAPLPIAIDMPIQGTTVGLNGNHGASCGFGADSPEVVYTLRPAAAGPLCVTTVGSAFDTVLHIREAQCADGEEVACNDDDRLFNLDGNQTSTIELQAEANTTYYVFVDGYGDDSSGDYTIEVRGRACDAPWGNGQIPECLGPGDIAPGQSVRGNTADGPENHAGSCGGDGPEAVYLLSVPFQTPLCATTANSEFDTVLYVRQDACAGAVESGCNDDIFPGNTRSRVSFVAEANTDYYLFVDAYGLGGNYQLDLAEGECE